MVSGSGLTDRTLVGVQLTIGGKTTTVTSEVIDGRVAVIASPDVLDGVSTIGVLVRPQGGDAVYHYTVTVQPLTDVCKAEGGIALARDCATPNSVLATVEASGLTAGGRYGISVVGTSPSGEQVELASADVVSADGTLDGTLALESATGTVPLDGFTGVALLVDGQVFASVGAADAEVTTCVVAAPLPAAPVATPVVVTHPVQPAALAQTGSPAASLGLLGVVLLGLGGLTMLLARRAAR